MAHDFLGGDTFHGPAERRDISRNLIRVEVEKYQAGILDADARTMGLLQEMQR